MLAFSRFHCLFVVESLFASTLDLLEGVLGWERVLTVQEEKVCDSQHPIITFCAEGSSSKALGRYEALVEMLLKPLFDFACLGHLEQIGKVA